MEGGEDPFPFELGLDSRVGLGLLDFRLGPDVLEGIGIDLSPLPRLIGGCMDGP